VSISRGKKNKKGVVKKSRDGKLNRSAGKKIPVPRPQHKVGEEKEKELGKTWGKLKGLTRSGECLLANRIV